MTRVEPDTAPETLDDRGTKEGSTRDHWLVSDPVRTGFLLILAFTMAMRFNILRDSYFITDDFMLMSRAVESPAASAARTWSSRSAR